MPRSSGGLTYLVTGGAGFIGSHLSETLLSQGHRVSAIDDLSTGRMANIAHLTSEPDFHFARADITNMMVMDRLASEADIIIHLAAAVGVKLIVEQPVRTIEANILGTEGVLRAALRYNRPVLVASTSEVYGKGYRIPFREEDDVVLGPTSRNRWAYAASKMVDEFLGFAYVQEYGLPVIAFRLFNTVGPRQSGQYGMVLPRFVRQALAGKPVTVYGDGSQSRCFCSVRDAARGIISLSRSDLSLEGTYNIGSTEEISIMDLAHLVIDMSESKSEIVTVPYEEAYAPGFEDMERRVPDITRIGAATGWAPRISLQDVVREVIGFERNEGAGLAYGTSARTPDTVGGDA